MPPKRASTTSSTGPAAKKAKKSPSKDTASTPEQPARRKGRWAAVSASANADDDYRLATKDAAKAYSFICMCKLPFQFGNDDSDDEADDWDEDSDEEEGGSGKSRCDGGKTCLCGKDAKDHPEHPWIVSYAGRRLYFTQRIHTSLRTPDYFSMYTWNDHASHGAMEVLQNLILDFVEAKSNWKEQWAICEATVIFLLSDEMSILARGDDAETTEQTLRLVGRAFLSMLARLVRENLFDESSEVKNLGRIMALYLKLAHDLREQNFLELDDEDDDDNDDDDDESLGLLDRHPERFDDFVVAYANKYGITLLGPQDIDDIAAECDGTVALPAADANENDPWDFDAHFKEYVTEHAVTDPRSKKASIGGDRLDITTWTPAERKSHSFTGKDPLGKKELDAIKKGMVMQLG